MDAPALDRDAARDPTRLRAALATPQGVSTLGSDPLLQKEALATMARFLDARPPAPNYRDAGLWDLPLGELRRRTVQTAVDILNDLATLVTEASTLSAAVLRRRAFGIFVAPERRLYVGVWLVVLSFLLYFIDAAS